MLLNFVLMDEEKIDFLALRQNEMAVLGFWEELPRYTLMKILERHYKTEIIREWTIIDFTQNFDKLLVKWHKRWRPLTDAELKEEYGRT